MGSSIGIGWAEWPATALQWAPWHAQMEPATYHVLGGIDSVRQPPDSEAPPMVQPTRPPGPRRTVLFSMTYWLLRLASKAQTLFPPRFCSHTRSEEHTSELQSPMYLVCRLLLEKKKHNHKQQSIH